MNTAFSTSVSAMAAAQAQLSHSARAVANPRAGETDVIEALVSMKKAETSHSAAAAIARTAAEMEDRLLDILA